MGVRGLAAVVLGALASDALAQELIEKDYCGVGAGPAGCQLGFFWETAQRDYVILEKSDGPGSFYRSVPSAACSHRPKPALLSAHTSRCVWLVRTGSTHATVT
jgi:hypothetical protein